MSAKHIYVQETNSLFQDYDFDNPGSEVAEFFSPHFYKKIIINVQQGNTSPRLFKVTFIDLNNVSEIFHNCLIVDKDFNTRRSIIPINPLL